MKNFFLKFLKIGQNPQYQKIFLLFGIFVLSVLFFKQCNKVDNYQKEILQNQQNISYYKDSLIISYNKAKELEYSRSVLSTDNENLKKINLDLYQEVQKQKGIVIYISKINGILQDSIKIIAGKNSGISTGTLADGTKYITFQNDTIFSHGNERHLQGKISFQLVEDSILQSSIGVELENSQKFSLVTGLEEDKDSKLLKIFVKPGSPNLTISQIDGALIDPQKSELIKSYFPTPRWTFGPQFLIGINSDLKPGFCVGFGVQYSLHWSDIKNLFLK